MDVLNFMGFGAPAEKTVFKYQTEQHLHIKEAEIDRPVPPGSKSQQANRLHTPVKGEERGIVGAVAAVQRNRGAAGSFLQRCQDMTHSSPDCNYRIPWRGNILE